MRFSATPFVHTALALMLMISVTDAVPLGRAAPAPKPVPALPKAAPAPKVPAVPPKAPVPPKGAPGPPKGAPIPPKGAPKVPTKQPNGPARLPPPSGPSRQPPGASPGKSDPSCDVPVKNSKGKTIHKRCDTSKDPLLAHITIDSSCAAHEAKVKTALSDAITLATTAHGMGPADQAFKNYFLPTDPDDVGTVPKVFAAIAGSKMSMKVTCPTEAQEPSCKGTLALTDTKRSANPPTMRLCPVFFTDHETQLDLNSKLFTTTGWCTAPPHTLGNFVTAGHTILHEMTHFGYIGLQAGLIQPTDNDDTAGTLDILGKNDENDGRKKYGSPSRYAPAAARTLQQHWVAFQAQQASGTKPQKPLKTPPLAPMENAESYAAAATEFYFAHKCPNFDPTQVTAAP
ncbi:hypothetical protein PLEOSDRAFT_1106377 [Pleurotus ostreatus PC15]|uniref:Lysine-specific metallo-endopeptidase domain-containing protein n=1 Tax=Pleurotus ostreatus (strain PC15) TaxID=1137138 RepID=A0A067NBP2_PLEO1|nr:hypothetical protein PLEOSDRAFT_1106377 [Pleurotus ostreatus PC15]